MIHSNSIVGNCSILITSFTVLFLLHYVQQISCAPPASTTGLKNATVCDVNLIDNCMLELSLIGDPKYRLSSNLEQMNKRCKRMKTLEKCIKDYSSKCLSSLASKSVSVLIYGMTRGNKNFCSNKNRKEDFIEIGRCINPDMKQISAIMGQLTRSYHGIKLHKNPKLRIPLICW